MTTIETNVESVLKGDRISFNLDSEPRKVLTRPLSTSAYGTDDEDVWIIYDEAGAPCISKPRGTAVFVHFGGGTNADR